MADNIETSQKRKFRKVIKAALGPQGSSNRDGDGEMHFSELQIRIASQVGPTA
jgi:hypothetical protein